MSQPHVQTRDPIGWCTVLAAAFLMLLLIRLTVPATPYFDEIHYLPAARQLLELSGHPNREHPLVGKEMIALGIALFGDQAMGWRAMPALAGTLALFAACRALWFASLSRFATLAYGILLVTGFLLFIHARIAMLDMFMVAFACLGAWQFAAAVRKPEHGRRGLALCGVAMGLAMGAKWNAIPVAVLPGLAFLAARIHSAGWRFLTTRQGAPVPGVSLAEAALWLGLVPLGVYWLTYLPAYFTAHDSLAEQGFFAFQMEMVKLQQSVVKPHNYMSHWQDWIINRRAIWYLYQNIDGAQRGVLLIGNPLTMLAGLPALLWCLWAGVKQHRMDALAVAAIYIASFGMWVIAPKPVQFYYHYFLPSMALLAALALALDQLATTGRRWLALVVLAGSVGLFGWFYPIISAAPLSGAQAYNKWMWLDSWR